MEVNRALDLSGIFNRDESVKVSPHERLAGLVFQWQGLRGVLRDQSLSDEEKLIYVRANVKTLHRLQALLAQDPQLPAEIRMLLSPHEVQQNWQELCEQRHALFTLNAIREQESVEVLLKRCKEFTETDADPKRNALLKEKTIETLAQILERSVDMADNATAIRHATNIHLMVYLDNIGYLHNPEKTETMRQILGEDILFAQKLREKMAANTSPAQIEKLHGGLEGFLNLRRMLDKDFPFSYVVKNRTVYERSLVLIKKAGYDIFSVPFYHALNATRDQMWCLNNDLYGLFSFFKKPPKLSAPRFDVPFPD